MKKWISTFLILFIILFSNGCRPSFQPTDYIEAIMQSICKDEHTLYADLTSQSSYELDTLHDEWLRANCQRLIASINTAPVSEEMQSRMMNFFNQLYANALYEIHPSETADSVSISIHPVLLFTQVYPLLEAYTNNFNQKNDSFGFTSLNQEAYYDTYLDGILDILEENLAFLNYGDAISLQIQIKQNNDGLYYIEKKDIERIFETILQWPEDDKRQ